jgi:alkylhydroperoxidase family enzyme
LHRRYKNQAEFLAIYVREAHPTDGWRMSANDRVGISIKQPLLETERSDVAKKCSATLEISMTLLVDEMDDRVGHAYSGMPDRLYLIDGDGTVAYKGGRGPFGFKPGELEQSLVMLLLDQNGQAKKPARVPLLSDQEAWKRLPPLEQGKEQPLPHWARALAGTLPRTTAHMIELDDLHRTRSPLDPRLRGKMRWVTAHANRCEYTKAYAALDLQNLGVSGEELQILKGDFGGLPENDRLALQFARKLTLAAHTVTDEEVAKLIDRYGEEDLMAMVALIAYANFHDRLLLSLGLEVEPGGPLKPLGVKFSRQPPEGRAVAPPRPKVEAKQGEAPSRIKDRDWLAADFQTLQRMMEGQRARQPRIRIPTWEEVKPKLPPGYPTNRPSGVRWSLVGLGYQPELTGAWLMGMRMFGQESQQDRAFEELVFWVITRSEGCFY